MDYRVISAACVLTAVFAAGSAGQAPGPEQAGDTGPRKVGQAPLVNYGFSGNSAGGLAQEGTYVSGESSGGSGMNPVLRVALGFLVPGLPQYLSGQWRSYGYFALEGASIAGLVVLNSQGSSRQERYIQLSRLARSNYVYPGLRNNPGEITDPSLHGLGEYYEDMTKWPSSGDYDDDPSLDGVQPESNPKTYNGHQWEIAKINNYSGTSGGLPVAESRQEEINALEAYKSKVYPAAYNWDWTGLDRENDRYHELFYDSEDALRRRSTFATILLANHLISGLDVLIQERINSSRQLRAARLGLHLEAGRPGAPGDRGLRPRVCLSHRF